MTPQEIEALKSERDALAAQVEEMSQLCLTVAEVRELQAEAIEKFSSALASKVVVPDASPTKIEYYKAAIRHVLQFAAGYAATVRQGGAE